MKRIAHLLAFCLPLFSMGQDVTETFHSTRIINAHSTEVLGKKNWEYRIEHRFGDIAGDLGGIQTAFGFDQAADIRIAVEHGFSNKWMVGFGRSKGIGQPYTSLLDGFIKGRILTQNKEKKMPISLAYIGTSYITYMKSVNDPTSAANYDGEFLRRMAFSNQLVISRKFSDRLTLALMPTITHRNFVLYTDVNTVSSVGAAINYKFTKSFGMIVEYFQNLTFEENVRQDFTNSLGVAFEFVTNGHNFHVNLTNARGFGDVQYIALNQSDWLKGQFRLGFSVSRTFKIRRK